MYQDGGQVVVSYVESTGLAGGHRRHQLDPPPGLSTHPASFTAAEVHRLLSDPAEVGRALEQEAAEFEQEDRT